MANRKKKSSSRKSWTWHHYHQEALGKWKKKLAPAPGLVSMIEGAPALRSLVEAWSGLPHVIQEGADLQGDLYTRVWASHELDILEAADLCGLDAHVFLRVLDRARKFGIVYPDGTLHQDVETYLKARMADATGANNPYKA